MARKYNEYKQLNLSVMGKEVLQRWDKEKIFEKSVSNREGAPAFTFYEGPPSANGMPGIHHVMARAIKDLFCRYKTLKGYQVKRKAGWDTHGLPVELSVEKALGITKEDIGKKISVEEYNQKCREDVMKYKDSWDELTRQIGFWLDLEDPYITFHNKYIESVWYLLKQLYDKDLLYKGYTVQPYSPAAGTGLSTHELNQPGCYRNVKDTSVIAQFKVKLNNKSEFLFDPADAEEGWEEVFFLAWTTTPWTLPSNCALAVGKNIEYVKVKTFNPYTHRKVIVILARELLSRFFSEKAEGKKLSDYNEGDKVIPYEVVDEFQGKDLVGLQYEQLLPYVQPEGKAFEVIPGDFVTTEDGTGIVHTASVFGADDFRVCKQNNISSIMVKDEDGNETPLVDKQGKFVKEVTDFAGRYVKPEYEEDDVREHPDYKPTDVLIAIKLKEENRAFKVEKYEHSYPHCWRTDKPVLYYPLDSWFIKTTAMKDRMIRLNKTINWKPAATGTGRFGNWLENLQDWNLSRSRYWGIPLPVWTTEDRNEQKCIGSLEELKIEIAKAVNAGVMEKDPLDGFVPGDYSSENYDKIDVHRPYVDEIVLVSKSGKKMYRETDLIDVWFDSGAMPYAQWHYPFENKEKFEQNFPADFIAEGVDQTRGWFFTLHAISSMLFDSVAFKTVVSNGLVLDKHGNKMSKRLGNAVDPFETIKKYGTDATRWYMITNAQPWDNLKFDPEGIVEVQRKYFGTLYNTYAFFALYANIDGFTYSEGELPFEKRPEIDRWILSLLNSLIKEVDKHYEDYEPTRAGRAIQHFVTENLSNWYVRLCRRRFWKGDYSEDKISAYQTLYKCLEVVAQLSSPIAPFYSDRLFTDLNSVSRRWSVNSVHVSDFPVADDQIIDMDLEQRMGIAQQISSMVLSLRKKEMIKVRQPLNRIMVPVLDEKFKRQLELVKELILTETNVKEMEYISESSGVLVKRIKPDFKKLGPRYGKMMKQIAAAIGNFSQEDIATLERENTYRLALEQNGEVEIALDDVEITSDDIPGWLVANEGKYTVALDITITKELKEEGIAREFVNKIQNLRKESAFDVTDRINLRIQEHDAINEAVRNNKSYICSETLAASLELVNDLAQNEGTAVEVEDNVTTLIAISKMN